MRRVTMTTGGWVLLLCLAWGTASAQDPCLDLDLFRTPEVVGRWGDGRTVRDIAVSDLYRSTAWVLFDHGMVVGLDLAVPQQPVRRGVAQVDSAATHLAVNGPTLAVAAPGGVVSFFDVGDPDAVRPLASLVLPGDVEDLCGRQGFLAACGDAGLVRFRLLSDKPEVVASTTAAIPCLSVAETAGRILVGTGAPALVEFRDDTDSFALVARFSMTGIPRVFSSVARRGESWDYETIGVALGHGGLRLFDADSRFTDRGPAPAPAFCRDVVVLADAVCALDAEGAVTVLTLPLVNASTMIVTGRLDAEPVVLMDKADEVLLLGTAGRGLAVAVLPTSAVSPEPFATIPAGGYVADADVSLAAVAGLSLTLIDPDSPAVFGSCELPRRAYDVALDGDLACVANLTNGVLVFDISDPSQPVLAGSIVLPEYAWDVEMVGTTAFVGAGPLLVTLDLSDPGTPVAVATLRLAAGVRDLAVVGDTLWVAAGVLHRIDISDPYAPVDLGWTQPVNSCARIAVSGSLLMNVSGTGEWVTAVDISDPAVPRVLDAYQLPTGYEARSVAFRGRGVWLGTDRGVLHLRLENGKLERTPAVWPTESAVFAVIERGDHLAAVRYGGVDLLPLECGALRPIAPRLELIAAPEATYLFWEFPGAGTEVCVFRDAGADPGDEVPLACTAGGFFIDPTTESHTYRVMYQDEWGVWSLPSDEVKRLPTPSDVPAAAGAVPLSAAPNPFNPRTELSFALARPGRATLAVHDLAGRRVKVLVDRDLAAGPHSAAWAGRDAAGRAVASGVYVARLATADGASSARLTLLK